MPSSDLATTCEATAPTRWMVLTAPSDPSGPWAWEGLRRRGFDGIQLVSIDALVYSTSLTHRLSSDGVSVRIAGPNGTVIGPDLIGTVNRAGLLPLDHLRSTTDADREYATQELYALFTSILAGLPGRVLNRAGPRGLSGPFLRPAEWAASAGAAGLTVRHHRYPTTPSDRLGADATRSVVVVGSTVLEVGAAHPVGAAPPAEVVDGCRRLARRVDVELLGADFEIADGRWLFAGATSSPDLRAGGASVLDALADLLQ